jgi:hypothetical protein
MATKMPNPRKKTKQAKPSLAERLHACTSSVIHDVLADRDGEGDSRGHGSSGGVSEVSGVLAKSLARKGQPMIARCLLIS